MKQTGAFAALIATIFMMTSEVVQGQQTAPEYVPPSLSLPRGNIISSIPHYQQHPAEFQQLFNSLPSVSHEIWRDTAGNVSIWLMNGTRVLQATVLGTVPLTWTIAQTGDFGWRSQERHSPAGMSPSG